MFKTLGMSLNGMKGLNKFARIVLYVFGKKSWKKNRKREAMKLLPSSINR